MHAAGLSGEMSWKETRDLDVLLEWVLDVAVLVLVVVAVGLSAIVLSTSIMVVVNIRVQSLERNRLRLYDIYDIRDSLEVRCKQSVITIRGSGAPLLYYLLPVLLIF